jgi:hypothetical protein
VRAVVTEPQAQGGQLLGDLQIGQRGGDGDVGVAAVVFTDRRPPGVGHGIRWEGVVDLQMAWSTALAPAADRRHYR